jgi:TrmH RNA methyltransferase
MKNRRPAGREDRPAKTYAADEVKVYGLNCCRAIFQRRAEDIIKVYYNDERKHLLGELFSWCSQNRRAYKLVPDEELERIADTRHHEGICMIVRSQPAESIDELLARCRTRSHALLLLLEDVENPHNLGAILRTAAHFQVLAVLIVGSRGALLSGAAMRVAEGGAEYVPLIEIGKDLSAVKKLKQAGFTLVGTSPRARNDLYRSDLPARAVIMLGSERAGLSRELMKTLDLEVNIPGSGFVESLNVASATSVVLSEFYRTRETAASRDSTPTRPPRTRPDGRSRPVQQRRNTQRRDGGRRR